MKCKRNGNVGKVALKLDISKACDYVDWGYLKGVLMRLPFDEKWISWIAMCVESVL